MKWKDGQASEITLIGLTLFSILIFYVAEQTAQLERQPHFDKKLQAAKLALVAREAIKNYTQTLGVKIDIQNDPYRTGLIGQERTPITSDRGIVTSKILATNPNYAAVFVDMLLKAKVKKGNTVAVGMTGSLPGWNISFLAACAALELKPIVISSVGASDWGANSPALTWLDMERVLSERGIIPFKSVAASVGGGADNGRGLSPEGRELLLDAIHRNNVSLIDESLLEDNIVKRLAIYDTIAAGQPIACYINIGGGIASIGGTQNAKLINPGLSEHLAMKNFPVRAVIVRMAERGTPVINLLNVEKIAARYDFPIEVGEKEPDFGEGVLFFKNKYSITSTAILTFILVLVLFVVIRIDVKHYLFKKPVSKQPTSEILS